MRLTVIALAPALLLAQPPVGSRAFRLDELRTPAGYEVSVYARVSGEPRFMTFGPDGVLYVAARSAGAIVAVPRANTTNIVIRGLNQPNSLVFVDNDLYVATIDGVTLFRNGVNATGQRLLSLPTQSGHISRTVLVGPDRRIYVSAGSTCNFCRESDSRRAAVTRYEPDGSGQQLFARGLRNSVGLAWHPLTGELWATENGGDGLGDDDPPEEINIIRQNNDYGWPDCIGSQRPAAWGDQAQPSRCPSTVPPEQEMQAHSAPLGISFYTGAQFPAGLSNDAFVAFHGSWNRNQPTGYKVVRIRAASGHAMGYEDFLWGFLDMNSRTASGRPVDPIPGPDGALYVSDDMTGNIYRVAYTGPRIAPGGIVQRTPTVFELYGANLVNDPTQLIVLANGAPVQVLYSSPTQINFAIDEGITGALTISVRNEKAEDTAELQVTAPAARNTSAAEIARRTLSPAIAGSTSSDLY